LGKAVEQANGHPSKVSLPNRHEQLLVGVRITCRREKPMMKFSEKIKQAGATGYILLWLLGIPIPILLLIFLLRGCT